MSLRIFISAPFRLAHVVRDMHDRIRALGHMPTSTWAETADGNEDLNLVSDDVARACWEANHRAASHCHVGIVIADQGGRETHCEAATMFASGRLVVWIGRETLTARVHRDQTRRVATVEEALAYLERMPRSVAAGGG